MRRLDFYLINKEHLLFLSQNLIFHVHLLKIMKIFIKIYLYVNKILLPKETGGDKDLRITSDVEIESVRLLLLLFCCE